MSSAWSDCYHACPESTLCCFCQRRHAVLAALGRAFWRLPRLRLRVGEMDLLHSAAGVAQYTVGAACLHASTPTCAAQRQRRRAGNARQEAFWRLPLPADTFKQRDLRTVKQARYTAVWASLSVY